MIVKSPMQKKDVRSNRRRVNPQPKRSNGAKTGGNGTQRIYGRKKKPKRESKFSSFKQIQPWKVIVGTILIGAAGLLYLTHIFATQQLHQEVQQLEREYNKAKRLHADYRLTYDRMTGPSEIYSRARELGFINGGPADKVIEVED